MADLKLRDLEKSSKGSVFVINETKGADRSQIFFTVPKNNGAGFDTVEVPTTFIPLDLTEQVTRKQLLESSEFRKCVRLGLLRIIDEETADSMLSDPDAREEQQRLRNLMSVDYTKTQDEALAEKMESESNMEEGVQPGVQQLMQTLEDNSEQEVLNTLRNMGELSEKDYQYVISKAENLERVKKYAQKKLSEVKA